MLTLLEEPNQWQPGYNPIIFRYNSDLNTQNNFEYLLKIDIQKMGSGGTFSEWQQIGEVSQPPRPDGTSTFDIHKYLNNELSYVFEPDKKNQVISVLDSGNIHLKYRVRPFEVYTTSLEWSFDRLYNSSDVTDPISQYGYLNVHSTLPDEIVSPFDINSTVIINFDSGNPIGIDVDGKLLNVLSNPGLKYVTLQSNWNFTNSPVINSTGTLKTINELTFSVQGATTSVLNTWNGVYDFDNYNDIIIQPGISPTASDPNYINNEVPIDKIIYRDGATNNLEYQFLTTLPVTGSKLTIEDYMWLNVNSSTYSTTLKVESNNGLYSFDLSNETTDLIKSETLQTIGVGPANLINGTSSVTVIAGTLPIIDSNTTNYKFYLSDDTIGFNPQLSSKYEVNIYNPCTIFEKQSIIYLDPLGSFLPLNFYLSKQENLTINKSNYIKNYGNPRLNNNNNNRWGYDKWDRGNKNIDTTFTQQFTMTTDWLDDIENKRMKELILSPEVYLLKNDEFYSINILNTTFSPKTRNSDILFNYSIKFEFSQKNRTNI